MNEACHTHAQTDTHTNNKYPRDLWVAFATVMLTPVNNMFSQRQDQCLAKAPVRIEQLKGHRADLCRKAMGKTIQTFLGAGDIAWSGHLMRPGIIQSCQNIFHLKQPTYFPHRFLGSQPQHSWFFEKSETFMCPNMGYIMVFPPNGSKWQYHLPGKAVDLGIPQRHGGFLKWGTPISSKSWMTMTS